MQWTASQQYIASVEASLVLPGCEGRLTCAAMRVVSNFWPDTIPSVQCAGQLSGPSDEATRYVSDCVRAVYAANPVCPPWTNRRSPRASLPPGGEPCR